MNAQSNTRIWHGLKARVRNLCLLRIAAAIRTVLRTLQFLYTCISYILAFLIYLQFSYTCNSHILAILIYLQFSYTCNSYILAILIYNYNKVPLTSGILLLYLRSFYFSRIFRNKKLFFSHFSPWISLCPGRLGTGRRFPAFVPHGFLSVRAV